MKIVAIIGGNGGNIKKAVEVLIKEFGVEPKIEENNGSLFKIAVESESEAYNLEKLHSALTILNEEGISVPETIVHCPVCGEAYANSEYGHSFDSIFEFGKCTECLDCCPYCEDHQ